MYGIEVRDASKSFEAGAGTSVTALAGVSVTVRPGEFLAIVGHNGSGKSTLLRAIGGELHLDSGSVTLVDEAEGRNWPAARATPTTVARVFQDPNRGTFPRLTVFENMRMAVMQSRPSVLRRAITDTYRDETTSRLSGVGLDQKGESRAQDLSGGQRQMLAIEMAFVAAPKLLLLDEHTASLDRANEQRCMSATASAARAQGITLAMVTHNLSHAIEYSDRILVLQLGEVVANLAEGDKARVGVQELARLCGYF
ncbi:MAG: ATP-binding cassette domain-containing protein [Acidobacteria bacterium]|nr:ATP-binding cassette domain-containing protein [Acidobacteriota bacterium]